MFNFKVAVFDLDETLWNGQTLFPDVVKIFDVLKQQSIAIYIASYHLDPSAVCKQLGIDKYISGVFFGRDRLKSDMIKDIMTIHGGLTPDKFIFFDDRYSNIKDVREKTSINTVCVYDNGLRFSHINEYLSSLYGGRGRGSSYMNYAAMQSNTRQSNTRQNPSQNTSLHIQGNFITDNYYRPTCKMDCIDDDSFHNPLTYQMLIDSHE